MRRLNSSIGTRVGSRQLGIGGSGSPIAGGSAPVTIPTISATHWRFVVDGYVGHPSIGEIQFAQLGQAAPTPASYISSGDFGGLPASAGFDGDTTTAWGAATAATGVYLGAVYASPNPVNLIRICGRRGFGQYPTAGTVQYSLDGGSTWLTAFSVTGLSDTGTDANVMANNGALAAFADPNMTGENYVLFRLKGTTHDADATTICEWRLSDTPGGPNLLAGLGAFLFASDSINSTNVPNQVVDGDAATFWASTVSPVALIAELDAGHNAVAEMGIVPRDNGSGAAYQFPTAFELDGTPDGLNWTQIQAWTGLTTGWTAGVERVLTV